MRLLYLLLLIFCTNFVKAINIEQDSLIKDSIFKSRINNYPAIDSVEKARITLVRDSLIYTYLKPNPNRANQFTDSLLKTVLVYDKYLLTPPKSVKIKKNNYGFGEIVANDPVWFLLTYIILLIFFAIIKILFKKEIDLIFMAFFDKRTLGQVNKEDNVFVSWQFLFLYLNFVFSVGLFVCLIFYKSSASASAAEFSIFLLVSLFAFVFFGLKILVLRLLGFVFKVQKLVRDYTNIIYLTYFNLLFVLLPITFCLVLINLQEQYYVFWTLMILFSGIITFQFLRITFNILLNYRIPKFYLIIYLCALEICPILIFAKTINTSL